MNRLCPSEEILSEYISGVIDEKTRFEVEKHLVTCHDCRKILVETYDVINSFDISEIWRSFLHAFSTNRWLIASSLAFLASFIFPRHFLQFLTASLLTGAKWILDAKNTRMLIMIHEAWKSGDKTKQEEILSRLKDVKKQ